MQKKTFLCALLTVVSYVGAFALTVDNLRVQALRNPSGIDQSSLQFTWQLQSAERGVVQTSYHLVLTTDAAGEDVIFDSGVVQSSQSVGVEVRSLSLQPARRYFWHVTVQDNKGQTATSKETAYFETGLMGTGWSGAKWIKASEVLAGQATDEVTDYIVEGKVRIEHTAAGLCFAMQDNSNFYFWQLNTEGDYPRLRPHVWKNGNPACLDNINLTGKVALNNTDEFTLRIEVTGAARARTYINDVLVDDRTGDFKFGRVGMREDHGERDGQPEIGVYDDIRVTTTNGNVLLSEDFEQGNGFTGGTVTGGKLRIVGSTNGHVLVWQKQSGDKHVHYALDWDMYLVKASAAVIFAATSSNTYHMWQINAYDNANPAVRHHTYINGNLSWDDAQFTLLKKSDILSHKRHYRVEVEGAVIYTFVDGLLVDTYTDNTGTAVLGDIGMRVDNNAGEEAYYDNLILTEYDPDGTSHVRLSEDFEGLSSEFFYDAVIEDFDGSRMCHVKSASGEKKVMQATTDGMPQFRKTFMVSKQVASATLFTSGLGVYDLFMNGQRVGHVQPDGTILYEELKPGWTDFRYRVFYSTHDVTSLIAEGKNAIGAVVTPGWWAGAVMHGAYGSPSLGFLAKLLIRYSDGTEDVIVSDLSWLSSKGGALKLGDIYDGEIYDARLASNWTAAEYDDSRWNAVRENVEFKGQIDAFTGGYVRTLPDKVQQVHTATIHEGVKSTGTDFGMANAVSTTEGPAAVLVKKGQSVVFDFGQNVVGWVNFKVKGRAGNRLKMRFVEMLNDTGSRSRGNDGPGGTPYLANLRSAKASLYYTLCGTAEGESYHSSTTFFGFRYCEVTPSDDVEILAIEAQPVSSSTEDRGSVETSNALVNQLFSNITWGQRGNLLSVPTDCPQRDERLGWMADTQVFTCTGLYNAYMESFYRKWMQDVRDGQNSQGAYPGVAPECWGTPFGQTVWADAGIVVPWTLYVMTGNKDVIRESYESMERYMTFLSRQVFDGYQYNGGGLEWGDWLSFVTTDTRYIAVAYYAYVTQLMAKMSRALSESDADAYAQKAAQYDELFLNIKDEFRLRYITPTVRQNTQTALLMALQFNLLEGETEIENFKTRLTRSIRSNGYKLNTGFAGTPLLGPTLSRYGLNDYAYDLLLQRKCPSWLYSVDQGATTIWERWNSYTKESGFGDPGMNSFNHYAYGAVGEWMYRYMCGIQYDEQQPGFKHIILQPQPDCREALPEGQELITSASAHHQSYYGDIRSAWQTANLNEFTYDCTVPANTTATLFLPVGSKQTAVYESERPAAEAEGVEYVGFEEGCQVYRLGSGAYHFTTSLKDAITDIKADGTATPVYDLGGRLISSDCTSVQGMRDGIYVTAGKKVMTHR
ncbi:MAG: family 78 glycoside hydrolase catalytic domain [Bacteroidaceae bacterium]|nr:family 78 glycoside hydrolase catalytic domain [Bacteroidaceae bacterium]